jgi:hypothetical protein
MSDIRTISPRVLAGIDHASHGTLLALAAEAFEEKGHEIDLQIERVGAEFFLDVTVLLADLVVRDRCLGLGVLEAWPPPVQACVMSLWCRTLIDGADRSRARALAGIREIDRRLAASVR